MSVSIYGIRNCSTMKKAFDWLERHGVEFSFHDYRKSGIDPATLAAGATRPDGRPWSIHAAPPGASWTLRSTTSGTHPMRFA